MRQLFFFLLLLPLCHRVTAQTFLAVDTTGLHSNPSIEEPLARTTDCFGPGENRMPVFLGGDTALVGFLNKHIHWPDTLPTSVHGKVYVRFTVDRKGSVRNIAVMRSLHPAADAEATRVVSLLSGHFLPGTNKKRQPIDVDYTLPLYFNPQPRPRP